MCHPSVPVKAAPQADDGVGGTDKVTVGTYAFDATGPELSKPRRLSPRERGARSCARLRVSRSSRRAGRETAYSVQCAVGLAGLFMRGVRMLAAHGERGEPEPAATGKADRRSAAGRLRGPQDASTTRAPAGANYSPSVRLRRNKPGNEVEKYAYSPYGQVLVDQTSGRGDFDGDGNGGMGREIGACPEWHDGPRTLYRPARERLMPIWDPTNVRSYSMRCDPRYCPYGVRRDRRVP